MARVQPVLSDTEAALVKQMAQHVVAHKPTGEEVAIETAELAALEGPGHSLFAEELSVLAKQLAKAANPTEAARLRERLTRGFYGI